MVSSVSKLVAARVGGGEAVGGVVDGARAAREPVMAPEERVEGTTTILRDLANLAEGKKAA